MSARQWGTLASLWVFYAVLITAFLWWETTHNGQIVWLFIVGVVCGVIAYRESMKIIRDNKKGPNPE